MAASFLFSLREYIMISQLLLKLILLIALPSFILLFFRSSKKNSSKANRLPPGPPKLPLIGNMHQFRNPLHKSLHDLAKKYGDIMLLQVGSVPTLVISSADIAREITKSHDVAFSGRAATHVIKKFSYNCADLVFSPYGEFWKEIRKLSVTELLSAKRVQSFQKVREEEVTLLLDNISRSSGPIELDRMLRSLSVNVLTSTAFGTKFQATVGTKSIVEILQEAQSLTGVICFSDFFPWLGWLDKLSGFDAKLDKIFRQLDELYDKVIQDHLDPSRCKAEHEDLVDVLLRLQNDPTQTVATSKNFVKAVITDMFAAGSETTGTTLVWAMTELIRNPLVMKRAQKEVREIAKGQLKVNESDLQQLVYLKAIVKETMRLHSPAPLLIPRETIEPCKIRDYEIPAKMRVFINVMPIAMDPTSWESPQEFRPERFLDSPIDFRGQHFEYVPFGFGRRICPGINFSVVVLELVIANLLYRFDWELPRGMAREDVDVEETFSLVTSKKTPLYLVAKPRSE